MFSVLFEVQPKPEKWDEYLDNAKMLRPELEQIDGFVDNIQRRGGNPLVRFVPDINSGKCGQRWTFSI